MDPSACPMYIPSSAFRPLMYNFLQVPPVSPSDPTQTHQVREPNMHCCAEFMELQSRHLQWFWQEKLQEMDHPAVYEHHQLPLARIKKTMKLNGNVKMVSAESPILLSKACELFILEITLRSWLHVEEQRRQTMQRGDIANAIFHSDSFEFLINTVQVDEVQDINFVGT